MSELGSDTHELLRKARQGTPALPPEVRKRVRGAVMTGAGLSTVAAGMSFAKVIAIGVVSASLGSVATMVVTKRQVEQPTTSLEQPRTAPVAPVLAPAPVVETVTPPPETPTPVRAEPVALRAAARPPPPVQAVPTIEPKVDERSLAAELETLEGILSATDAANWSEARVRLGAYHSRFEDGHFQTEARALEVLTLCGEHHVDAARTLRLELLTVEPLNPAVLRLSSSCAAE